GRAATRPWPTSRRRRSTHSPSPATARSWRSRRRNRRRRAASRSPLARSRGPREAARRSRGCGPRRRRGRGCRPARRAGTDRERRGLAVPRAGPERPETRRTRSALAVLAQAKDEPRDLRPLVVRGAVSGLLLGEGHLADVGPEGAAHLVDVREDDPVGRARLRAYGHLDADDRALATNAGDLADHTVDVVGVLERVRRV